MYNVWVTVKYRVVDEESISDTVRDLEDTLLHNGFTFDTTTWEHEEAGVFDD